MIVQVGYAGCLHSGIGGGSEEKGMNSRSNYEFGLGDTEKIYQEDIGGWSSVRRSGLEINS